MVNVSLDINELLRWERGIIPLYHQTLNHWSSLDQLICAALKWQNKSFVASLIPFHSSVRIPVGFPYVFYISHSA